MKSFILPLFLFLALPAATLLAEEKTSHWSADARGIPADGQTDVTESLQALLNQASESGGGTVELGTGRYCVRGNLAIPAGVTLQGTFHHPPTVHTKDQPLNGTVLLAYAGKGDPEGKPFIQLAGSNAMLEGVVIIYPEWDRSVVPPVPYPPCIESHDTDNTSVVNCCLLNPYEGIRLVRAARHLLRNITGYPIWRGLYVDECYDIGHVENFHYWPFGLVYNPKDPYCEWINKNGIAFEFARTDWEYVSNTFCFGYGVGYQFSASPHGSANGNFLGLGADSCRRAVLVEQSQAPGLLITNGEFVGRWTSQDSVCLEILEGNQGKVSLVNCSFWGPIDSCVRCASSSSQFTASACHFVNWDISGKDSPAIEILRGKAMVSSCTFEMNGTHVSVQPEVRSAVLTGNQAEGGFVVEGAELPQTVLSANEQNPLEQWTDEQKKSYSVKVGSPEDSGFLRGWFAPETSRDAEGQTIPCRWSRAESKLVLPVIPGKKYRLTVRLESNLCEHAAPETAGLWLGETQLGTFARKLKKNELTVEIPPRETSLATVTLRVPGWVPARRDPNSHDTRELGVRVTQFRVESF